MPIVTGFTPTTQTESLLVTGTTDYQRMSASYSELTGQPTPLALPGSGIPPTAPATGTTETFLSSIASCEPVLPTTTSAAPATEAVTVTASASASVLANPVTELAQQTQTTSPRPTQLEGQADQSSSDSEALAAQFEISPRPPAPDSSASFLLVDP